MFEIEWWKFHLNCLRKKLVAQFSMKFDRGSTEFSNPNSLRGCKNRLSHHWVLLVWSNWTWTIHLRSNFSSCRYESFVLHSNWSPPLSLLWSTGMNCHGHWYIFWGVIYNISTSDLAQIAHSYCLSSIQNPQSLYYVLLNMTPILKYRIWGDPSLHSICGKEHCSVWCWCDQLSKPCVVSLKQ